MTITRDKANRIAGIIVLVIIMIVVAYQFDYLEIPNGDSKGPDPNKDSDNDGISDDEDRFPEDPDVWQDTDKDGVGDNEDAFPEDRWETVDSDNDGIGDNADLYDGGNLGITINITSYESDIVLDEIYIPDPYFIIKVDVDYNEKWNEEWDNGWDFTETSETYYNRYSIKEKDSFFSLTFDLLDNQSFFIFRVEVQDSDFFTSNEKIDYYGDGDNYWCSYEYWGLDEIPIYWTNLSSYDKSYSENGANDEIEDEMDCRIEFNVKVVVLD